MTKIPRMRSVMTPFPYSIDIDAPIVEAEQMMHEHDIRHLPVKDGTELAGVVTDRDIKRSLDPQLGLPPKDRLLVRHVSVLDAYVVDTSERLDVALLHMAENHLGSALVTKDGRLAGIFTTTDACRAFGEYLRSTLPIGPDEDDVA